MERQTNPIYTRRSTRCFDPSFIIPKEIQIKILEAGIKAPSAKNRQPWSFIVLDKKEDICQIADILDKKLVELRTERIKNQIDTKALDMAHETVEILKSVSLLIFVCYLRNGSGINDEEMGWAINALPFEVSDILSIGACVENMLIAAEAMEIDSLWICDIFYAERELAGFLQTDSPIVSAAAFGKGIHETNLRAGRYGVSEKTRWF